MPRSRTDLVVEVLDVLKIIQTGQAPSAEDAEHVDSKIDGQLARLSRQNVVYIQNVNAIDDEYFRPLAVIIAAVCDEGDIPDLASVQYNEMLLRSMQREPGANETVRACYY